MTPDILIEDTRWNDLGLNALSAKAARATLEHLNLDLPDVEISILACDDARIAVLNTDFRGKPQPTNVLSWPSEERAAAIDGGRPIAPNDPELGDIAISFDTCKREAKEMGLAFRDHVTHLIVHGILHLLGYDHMRDLDATLMEGIEGDILGKLGIEDPYKGN